MFGTIWSAGTAVVDAIRVKSVEDGSDIILSILDLQNPVMFTFTTLVSHVVILKVVRAR